MTKQWIYSDNFLIQPLIILNNPLRKLQLFYTKDLQGNTKDNLFFIHKQFYLKVHSVAFMEDFETPIFSDLLLSRQQDFYVALKVKPQILASYRRTELCSILHQKCCQHVHLKMSALQCHRQPTVGNHQSLGVCGL